MAIAAAALLFSQVGFHLVAQTRTVALTIDDLPFAGEYDTRLLPATVAVAANQKLLNAFARHRVPVTGFVIGERATTVPSGEKILRRWTQRGFDLGNHTYGHPNFDELTVEQFEEHITRGEAIIAPLMRTSGRKPEFFRFPFNHAGDTTEKRDVVSAFLAQRGYRLSPCTIENSDWIFDAAYAVMLARHDLASAAKLRADYVAFTSGQIDYFAALNTQVLGYEPPEIILLQDNRLNADVIDQLLALFEKRNYRWVTLTEAEQDAAYKAPDRFITKYGPMWGYRWARDLNVKVDGSLEPDMPKWIPEYNKSVPVPPRRPRSDF